METSDKRPLDEVQQEKALYIAEQCRFLSELYEQLAYSDEDEQRDIIVEQIDAVMLEIDDIIAEHFSFDFEFELE